MGVKRYGSLILLIVIFSLLFSSSNALARENFRGVVDTVTRSMSKDAILASKESCIQCHTKVTPMIVAQHESSAHAKAGLDCISCHGKDHNNMPLVTGKKVCNQCHAQETKDMMASKHYDSWNKMWDNARYWNQSKAIRQQGCSRCHDIGYGFGNVRDVRCDYCHSTHEFSTAEAKNPATCTTCHMGPDHPQAEAYAASAHGKQANLSCVTCHDNHNVSKNIGIGGVSNGAVLENWDWVMDPKGKPKLKRPVITQNIFDQARAGNMAICNKCHAKDFTQQWLDGADQIKVVVEQQLLQAQQLVEELNKEGLIYPDPKTRPANPVDGQKLVLGGNQLYSGTSKAEAIYFKMYKFAAAQGWKSAYHQDFRRAGNNGLLEMNKLMGELQDEAKVLRLLGPLQNEKETVTKEIPKPNYLLYGLIGLFIGTSLAIVLYIIRRKKGKYLTGLSILILVAVATASFPKEAMAWSQNAADQKQCQKCHQAQADQLKTGKHSNLKCLDCHQEGAKVNQVKRPETCGKCHSSDKGYQLETYTSSPHGVQYQIKGENKWVPTCATCHMPAGTHNPKGAIADKNGQFKGMIGEVCLKCHTTDHVTKFNQDKKDIDKETTTLVNQLKQVGLGLIEKGILIPEKTSTNQITKLKEKWGTDTKWKMVKLKSLTPQEQEIAQRLVDELDSKTKAGLKEDAKKMRTGTAHVNPDYAHWYGNAFLNLDLTEAKSTAKEIEMLAKRAGYTTANQSNKQPIQGIFIGFITAVAGFIAVTYTTSKKKTL